MSSVLQRSIVWLVCCLSLTVQAAECERRTETGLPEIVLSNGEWPPYMTARRDDQGLMSEVVRQAFALRGVHVRYEFMPWNRALELARSGQCDGSLGWGKVDDRIQDFYFSAEAIGLEQTSFFHRRDFDFDWNSLNDLIGLRVSITHGYHYGDRLHSFLSKQAENVIQPYRDLDHLKLLEHKRADVAIIDRIVGINLIKENYHSFSDSPFSIHPKPLRAWELFVVLSRRVPGNEQLIKRFDEGLRELIKSGEYDRIMGYEH